MKATDLITGYTLLIMAIICSNCGSSNFDENNVCLECGSFINGLPVGTLLDNRYQIMEHLKAGGMGAVYLSFDTRLQQTCAVKEMFNKVSNEQSDYIVNRFMEEAKLLAGLNHPSIPRVIDYFSAGKSKYYLVMDYIEGRDLYTYVYDEGGYGLREELVLQWAIQICDVLHYLHTQPHPILHRDLKPSNLILREKDKKIVLIDFGLARTINPQTHTQKTVVGTMGYAPMEQYQGHPEPRSDLYSLGATMHFLLTAQESMPFKFPPVREVRHDVSEWIERVMQKALSLKPENRFSSAEEMYGVLVGDIQIESLVFSPDDTSGLDLSAIPREKPVSGRPLRISASHRQQEEHFVEMDPKKIISTAKTSRDKKLVEPLINILSSDSHDDNRRLAASVLGDLGDERAVQALIEALLQDDEHVRVNAAWALGKIGDSRAADALFCLYRTDDSKTLRNEARKSLVNLGSKRQGGEVVQFLLGLIEEDNDEYLDKIPKNSELCFSSLNELLIAFIKDHETLSVRFHLGLVYYLKGFLSEGILHLERAHQFKKNQPDVLYYIGKIYHEKDDLTKAIKYYEHVLKIKPSYKEAQDGLIKAYYQCAQQDGERGMFEEELEYYKRIISDFPDHSEISFIKAIVALKDKNTKEAVRYFAKYVEENPDGIWINDGQKYLNELQQNIFLKIFSKISRLFYSKKSAD